MARTLSVDCGGGGIKANVLDEAGAALASGVRAPVRYPLPPSKLLEVVEELAERLPTADRVTLGMPGMIRGGVVIATPHYVTAQGPRTRVRDDLVAKWARFDMAAALRERLGVPAVVLNDCEVAAAGVVDGVGRELVLTLGTGLGSALFESGALAPHLEFSHAPIRWGLTYDDYLGEHERLRLGDAHWSRRVRTAVESLQPVVLWDQLYLGGGNAQHLRTTARSRFGDEVQIITNAAGLVGGVRVWEHVSTT